ncbi:TIGR03086 family metal-binding protein [Plantibacter sp. YIM 135347]|uniref:TIGR03086 family metal-binding protein n=1 Tax=Plantibacter sp. YIM 135347 TaxID=3423919 RepID=UPI003D354FBA
MTEIDWLHMQQLANDEFGRRLDAVVDWNGETPDTDWTTRQLVEHVIEEQQWIDPLLGGITVRQATALIKPLSDDLRAEWERYAAQARAAWLRVKPTAKVHLSYDTVSVHHYLKEQVSDVTIHTWDLARATGSEEELPDELVEAVWTVFAPQQDTLEASGLFATRVELGEDAPLQSQLLALTGRDVRTARPLPAS